VPVFLVGPTTPDSCRRHDDATHLAHAEQRSGNIAAGSARKNDPIGFDEDP
jgi:hypothetical protein